MNKNFGLSLVLITGLGGTACALQGFTADKSSFFVYQPFLSAPASRDLVATGISHDFSFKDRQRLSGDIKALFALKGKGATPLHKEIFGEVSGANYGKYFADRVRF
ncbi:MAG TPA: hypothetical protein PLL10_04470, partial [Elusimicrobiales bacterium]|nr:hypothetical protein [Elusimicrobiales bacterium]